MSKKITEDFESSTKNDLVTGSLNFTNKYCSQFQIYKAAKEWAGEDKGVIYASIRRNGEDFVCLDFRYDESLSKKSHKSILHDYFKPLFKKKLGDDYMQAWGLSRDTILIK